MIDHEKIIFYVFSARHTSAVNTDKLDMSTFWPSINY